ncbi:MAG TPA: hypothetical protein VL832_17185, partial [Puia sp.]|nr:hypothetical protein [Puia sp.]
MSVLIFIDHSEGHVKKSSLEALSYGAKVAEQLGTSAEGILLGTVTEDLKALGKYGVQKIHQAAQEGLNHLDAQVFAKIVSEAVVSTGATVVIFSNNLSGKAVAPRVAARLKAGLVAGAVALPDTSNGFVVKKNVFSGKAFANIGLTSPIKVISLNPNSYAVKAGEGSAEIAPLNVTGDTPKVKVVSSTQASGQVPLTEAELVVSGGRGLKGPE